MTEMTDKTRARIKLVALIGVISALVLLLTLLAVRTVLLNQADRSADEAIVHELDEFIAAADGPRSGQGEQFDSEAALMRGFLAQRTPEEHTVLAAVSAGETTLLDNAQDGMGRRFVQDSPVFESLLRAETASGTEKAPGFGEIRWGKVLTDQEGAFLVVHFTAAAEEEVAGILWTFTWISAAALLLVSGASWFGIGLVQQILGRRRRRHHADADQHLDPDDAEQDSGWAVTPVRPLPEEASEPTVPLNELMGGAASSGRLRRTSAASLMLRAQHQLQRQHPDHRFVLALEDCAYGAGQTADVLGTLAQTEADLDVEAVETDYLNLAAEALERAEPGTAVVLGAGRTPPEGGAGSRLRLSVSAGSPVTSSMTVPLGPEPVTPHSAPEYADHPGRPGPLAADSVLIHS